MDESLFRWQETTFSQALKLIEMGITLSYKNAYRIRPQSSILQWSM